jgi:ABC-type transport system involved in multi-copper enzyme maturation permease subunit
MRALSIVIGLVLMAVGIYLAALPWHTQWMVVLLGIIPWLLFFIGLGALAFGISALKSEAEERTPPPPPTVPDPPEA